MACDSALLCCLLFSLSQMQLDTPWPCDLFVVFVYSRLTFLHTQPKADPLSPLLLHVSKLLARTDTSAYGNGPHANLQSAQPSPVLSADVGRQAFAQLLGVKTLPNVDPISTPVHFPGKCSPPKVV